MLISHTNPRTTQPDAWSPRETKLPTARLFNLDIVNSTVERTIEWICQRLADKQATRIAFLNAHCANVAAMDKTYRAALASTDALLPDGSGIALAARIQKRPLAANLNGTDLVPALCQYLAGSAHSIFLLGGRPGVAAEAAATLQRQCPGLRIAGTRDGYFVAAEEADVVREINASGASVLLVAMGVPLQDIWLERMEPQLRTIVSFGVGALFDFLANRVSRAPAVLRRLGLEWTWRLLQEPARMWRRYILGIPAFVLRVMGDAVMADARSKPRRDLKIKRMFDIAAAGLGMVPVAPLLLVVASIIRLTSPGPAFFRQTRIGKDGVPFTMYKLRSMYIDAAARRAALAAENAHGEAGVTFKVKRDPRITPIGRLIRKTSIDELPQLWNVLKGDMTLVGPRPQLPSEVAQYEVEHFLRLAGKPGLTCLWQISGRAEIAFKQQVELDTKYLGERHIFNDLMILLRTIPAVISARGAY